MHSKSNTEDKYVWRELCGLTVFESQQGFTLPVCL